MVIVILRFYSLKVVIRGKQEMVLRAINYRIILIAFTRTLN